MIIKPPKPGLGFGFGDLGIWDFGIWFGLAWVRQKAPYGRLFKLAVVGLKHNRSLGD